MPNRPPPERPSDPSDEDDDPTHIVARPIISMTRQPVAMTRPLGWNVLFALLSVAAIAAIALRVVGQGPLASSQVLTAIPTGSLADPNRGIGDPKSATGGDAVTVGSGAHEEPAEFGSVRIVVEQLCRISIDRDVRGAWDTPVRFVLPVGPHEVQVDCPQRTMVRSLDIAKDSDVQLEVHDATR